MLAESAGVTVQAVSGHVARHGFNASVAFYEQGTKPARQYRLNRTCRLCGVPIQDRNSFGVCGNPGACRREYRQRHYLATVNRKFNDIVRRYFVMAAKARATA